MPEYVKDRDGDVWQRDADGADSWYSPGLRRRTREEIEAFAPLTPCDVNGNDLPSSTPDDVRALLADAFDGLAAQMRAFPPFSMVQTIPDGMRSQMAEWVGQWAKDTAAGLRRP